MAALTVSGNHGILNGTTPVTLVSSPGVGVSRMVRALYINHTDSDPVVLHILKDYNTSQYQIHSQTMLQGYTLSFGDGDSIILVNGESLIAWLDSSPVTNPNFVVSWGDI